MKLINQRTFLILILTTVGCWSLAGMLFKINPVDKHKVAKAIEAKFNKKGNYTFSYSDADSDDHLQEHSEVIDIPANEVDSVEIFVTNSNVIIEGSKEANLTAKYKMLIRGDEKPMKYSLQNKILKIEIEDEDLDPTAYIHQNEEETSQESDGDLKVRIPKTLALKKLEIKSVNGQIKAVDLKTEVLDIANVNGDIKIVKVDSSSLDVAQVTGGIKLENSKLKKGEIASVDGDIKIQLEDPNDFFVETTTISGDIKNQQGAKKGIARGKLEVTSVAGDIKVSAKKNK